MSNAKVKEVQQQEEVKEETEADRVFAWRMFFFSQILGKNVKQEDIEALAKSEASPHQALKLRNMECPDDLIVAILV